MVVESFAQALERALQARAHRVHRRIEARGDVARLQPFVEAQEQDVAVRLGQREDGVEQDALLVGAGGEVGGRCHRLGARGVGFAAGAASFGALEDSAWFRTTPASHARRGTSRRGGDSSAARQAS